MAQRKNHTKAPTGAAGKTPGKQADMSDSTDDRLDKVRDILFGSEAQKSARRFGELEQRISREMAELRREIDQRLGALEESLQEEIEALGEELQEERGQREAGTKELAAKITETARTIGKRITALQDSTAGQLREHKKALAEQGKALRAEAVQHREELGAEVDEELAELREQNATRAELAKLFGDLSQRLGGEPSRR